VFLHLCLVSILLINLQVTLFWFSIYLIVTSLKRQGKKVFNPMRAECQVSTFCLDYFWYTIRSTIFCKQYSRLFLVHNTPTFFVTSDHVTSTLITGSFQVTVSFVFRFSYGTSSLFGFANEVQVIAFRKTVNITYSYKTA